MNYKEKYQTIKNAVKKHRFLRVLLCFFSLVVLTSAFPLLPTVYASGQTIRVSPVIINITLSPGKTYTHEVTIENLTTTALPFRASLNDFSTSSEEGGYVFEDTKENPLLQWIKLSETEFILNPKEKKKIQMTITTPKSIALGGYYGILFFEPVLQSDSSLATQVTSKVGILMLANIGVTDANAKKAEILDFSTGFISQDGNLPLLLRVKNLSLNFFTAKPILTLTPLISLAQSNEEKPWTLENKVIFPGQVRRWTQESTAQSLSPNIYKAQMAVSTGNGQSVATEKYVIVFPFAKALGLAAIFLILLFLIIKRNRLRKAITALLK